MYLRTALLSCVLVTAACQQAPLVHFNQTSVRHEGIQGGTADTTDTGVVVIYIDLGGGQGAACSGSLIAPNLVLTARHCVAQIAEQVSCGSSGTSFGSQYMPSQFVVYNGQTPDPQKDFGYQVHEVRVVPGSDLACGYDVALLILSQKFATSTATLLTPRLTQSTYGGESYSAVGYGNTCGTCMDGGSARNRRNGLSVQCVGESGCGVVGQNVMADNEWAGDDGVCSGDSGGPALDANGNVIGVASRAGVSGNTCTGSIYQRIDVWKDFILQAGVDAASYGGYTPPAWVTGNTDAGTITPPMDCTTCQNQAIVPGDVCGSAWSSCVNDTDCAALNQCLSMCASGDSTCEQNCVKQHTTGAKLFDAVGNCICGATACATACASSCQTSSCGYSLGDATCDGCFQKSCCSQGAACANDATCSALVTCLNGCASGDQTCINNCSSTNSAGVSLLNAMVDCINGPCGSACGSSTSGTTTGIGGTTTGGTPKDMGPNADAYQWLGPGDASTGSKSKSGCDMSGSSSTGGALWILALFVLALAARRRRSLV